MPLSLEDGQRLMGDYVRRYNEVRLHSAIGYVTPADKLASRDLAISAARSLHVVHLLATVCGDLGGR
ncbi:MAG TPA: integrase core domain-containing protein [Isosphaeraceae bacterium]|nr:integrase core domain-containing protein [Isosphaeraceae bacterium]